MSSLKILTAAIAAASFGLAFAQGTPPYSATDPATGAGQSSTQNTPMGTTGTPPGGGAMGAGGTGTTAGTAADTGASPAGSQVAADTQTTTPKAKAKKHRKVRKTDRN